MKKIENEIFYHINRSTIYDGKWLVGNTILFGPTSRNHFFNKLTDDSSQSTHEYINRLKSLHKLLTDSFNKPTNFIEDLISGIRPTKIEETQSIVDCIRNHNATTNEFSLAFLRFLRESIFEDERKQNYPEYPSRYSSIWLTSKKDLESWIQLFNSDCRIFKVEATGNILNVNGKLLDQDLLQTERYSSLAKQYWSGDYDNNIEEMRGEYLLEGTIKIIEQFGSLKEVL